MNPIKKAWWRGKKVAAERHPLAWYARALAAYSEAERDAFMDGYSGLPCPE